MKQFKIMAARYNEIMQEYDAGLSEREREVLRLAATGASNKEIAQQLGISANTVKVHLRNIFQKTGAGSRTESALYAVRHGLLDGDVNAPAEDAPFPAAPAAQRRLKRWPVWFLAVLLVLTLSLMANTLWGRPRHAFSPTPTSLPETSRRWLALAPLPQPRSAMAATALQGDLYIAGGKTERGVTGEMLRFSSVQGTWQVLAPKPAPVHSAGAAVLGERLYVPGGATASGQMIDLLEVYDLRADRWHSAARLPEPLAEYALAAFEGRLYLFGGRGPQGLSSWIWVYDPQTDSWSDGGRLPTPRAGVAAAALESGILVAGGWDGEQALAETLVYYPERARGGEDAWEVLPPLPAGGYGMGVTALAGSVYLAGGSGAGGSSLPLLRYAPGGTGWNLLPAPALPPVPGMALVGAGAYLHMVGGEVEGEFLTRHESCQIFYTILVPLIP